MTSCRDCVQSYPLPNHLKWLTIQLGTELCHKFNDNIIPVAANFLLTSIHPSIIDRLSCVQDCVLEPIPAEEMCSFLSFNSYNKSICHRMVCTMCLWDYFWLEKWHTAECHWGILTPTCFSAVITKPVELCCIQGGTHQPRVLSSLFRSSGNSLANDELLFYISKICMGVLCQLLAHIKALFFKEIAQMWAPSLSILAKISSHIHIVSWFK